MVGSFREATILFETAQNLQKITNLLHSSLTTKEVDSLEQDLSRPSLLS